MAGWKSMEIRFKWRFEWKNPLKMEGLMIINGKIIHFRHNFPLPSLITIG